MKAGRELDALVSEEVMRWPVFQKYSDWIAVPIGQEQYPCIVWSGDNGWLLWRKPHQNADHWKPSTDIRFALEAAEKICNTDPTKYWEFDLHYFISGWENMKYSARFYELGKTDNAPFIIADTAPLAICLAALNAVGVDI